MRRFSQMWARPVRHIPQCPQNRWVSAATKAPVSSWCTSGPSATTRPATSCPNVIGTFRIRFSAQESQRWMCRSVPQIEAASTFTRTSPSAGTGTGISSSDAPGPAAALRRARIVAGIVSPSGALIQAPLRRGSARSLPNGRVARPRKGTKGPVRIGRFNPCLTPAWRPCSPKRGCHIGEKEPTMTAGTTGLDADTLEMAVSAIRDFARDKLSDQTLIDIDQRDVMPLDLVREMCGPELGVQLLFVPEEHGGMGGGAFDVYRVCELMAGIDLGIATAVLATFLGSDPIRVGGTDVQRKE